MDAAWPALRARRRTSRHIIARRCALELREGELLVREAAERSEASDRSRMNRVIERLAKIDEGEKVALFTTVRGAGFMLEAPASSAAPRMKTARRPTRR